VRPEQFAQHKVYLSSLMNAVVRKNAENLALVQGENVRSRLKGLGEKHNR